MKRLHRIVQIVTLLATAYVGSYLARADDYVLAPTPRTFYYTSNTYPFLIKQNHLTSMRYQQVYNGSLFTNISSNSIYVTLLKFYIYYSSQAGSDWTLTNLQINLSTSAQTAGNLSLTFSENVGRDDTVVWGPGSFHFPNGGGGVDQDIPLTRPFRYNPTSGNLLLDVRVLNGAGPYDANLPAFIAYNSPTDGCSRVWSANVASPSADGADTLGIYTVIQLSPIPTLTAQFFPNYYGESNIIQITWPPQPSVFRLQRSDRLGPAANWAFVTNTGVGLAIRAASAGHSAFFRLVWTNASGASVVGGSPPGSAWRRPPDNR